jgi:hypothetical protein
LAALFLIVLLVASGSFFGMKVARAHRGEPWVATEAFKNNLATIGPYGVSASAPRSTPGRGPYATPASRRVRILVRPRPAPRPARSEGLHFALALLLAGCAFTAVCALLGMLAWEFALGSLAATGLFAAVLLEPRPVPYRPAMQVAYLPEPAAETELEPKTHFIDATEDFA